jgi:hypothetical protein
MNPESAPNLSNADSNFVQQRLRASRYWLAWVCTCIATLGAAAAYMMTIEPSLLTPLSGMTTTVMGDTAPMQTRRLALLAPLAVWALFLALAGGILMSLARRAHELRLLRIISQLRQAPHRA